MAGNGQVRSLGDNGNLGEPSPVVRARADTTTASSNAVGGRAVWGTVNPGEVLLKTVMFDQPERKHKLLIGWNQKVSGQVQGLQRSSVTDDAPNHPLVRFDASD